MKLIRLGNPGFEIPAIIDKDNNFRSIKKIVDDLNPKTINFETIEKIEKINIESLPLISKKERIGPCVNNPGKFIGIGLNFIDHAKEQNLPIPKEPIVFSKAVNCIIGPNDDIVIPKNSKKTDWEVEIAFVIGKKTKNIKEEDAIHHIFGYCIVNDVSERDFQKNRGGQWIKGKSADTFGPVGPYLVTTDEMKNVQNLNMYLNVNGIKMQNGNTKNMIFNINFILSYLSNFMTLLPGDIITTGTPPGVGDSKKTPQYLKINDKVQLGIDCLGEQCQKVK